MGRPRSNYICPKCGKPGYLENNPTRNGDYPYAKTRKYRRVVHYNSITKKRNRCYVDYIFWNLEFKELLLKDKNKIKQLSNSEIQERYLQIQKENKEMRIRIKAEKELIEQISKQRKVRLPDL